ncbi:MAG: ribbon-helix-helix domain-containing protein [Ottowia sp.]|nr:ribbon-helix-helix domain-containing protein [Ottowia sp.]
MSNVRWNVVVSPQVDQSVRMFLAARGGKKGDLSRFIEEAVRAHLLDSAANQAKRDVGASMSEEELDALVDEAVQWARNS